MRSRQMTSKEEAQQRLNERGFAEYKVSILPDECSFYALGVPLLD